MINVIRYSYLKTHNYLQIITIMLMTIVEGDPKVPFSIATTARCREGRYSILRIARLYS